MRKYLLYIFLLTGLTTQAQKATFTLEELSEKWNTRTITVPNGGKQPGIIQLLNAFNKTWPTYTISTVLDKAKNPNFKKMKDETTTIIVDRPNGYVCLDNGGTDDSYMEGCIWRRDNGHRLLAIILGQPVDPEIEVVCFYDYDPARQTLTPEEGPLKDFKPSFPGNHYNCSLPRKGKDLVVNEYLINLESNMEHVYTWDGHTHHFAYDKLERLELGMRWFDFKETREMGDFIRYALVDLDNDNFPEMLFSDGDPEEEGIVVLSYYKGRCEVVGIQCETNGHELVFYPGVVCTKAHYNDYTSYAFLEEGIVDKMITVYPKFDPSNERKVTIDGPAWPTSPESSESKMSEKEADQRIQSLGQPIQIQPVWIPLKVEKE